VRASDFFHDLDRWLDEQAESNGRVSRPDIVPNLLSPALERLSRMVREKGKKFKQEREKFDFNSAADRLAGLAGELELWIKQELPEAVFWLERSKSRRGHTRVQLCAAPIDVGPALREALFDTTPCVVMTSATLAVGKGPLKGSGFRVQGSGQSSHGTGEASG